MKNVIIIGAVAVSLIFLFGVLKIHTLFYDKVTPQTFWAGLRGRLTAVSKGEFNF